MPLPLLAIPALAQAGIGAFQSIFSGRKKAQRELESAYGQSPAYTGSKPINEYYQTALNRYNENPFESQQYQMAQKGAERGTTTGISALQDRRSALSGIGRLVGIQNDALAQAGVNAENERNRRFGQLGGATQMKSADDRFMFDTNVMSPYQRRLQMATMKAQGANDRFNAGLSNIGTGLSNLGMGAAAGLFGGGKTTNSTPSGTVGNLGQQNTIGRNSIGYGNLNLPNLNPNTNSLSGYGMNLMRGQIPSQNAEGQYPSWQNIGSF